MIAIAERQRAERGQPRIAVSNGRLQIHVTYQGRRRYISVGLPDTELNRIRAEEICREISKDLAYSNFDESLDRYRMMSASYVPPKPLNESKRITDLLAAWERYAAFKDKQIELTTKIAKYQVIENWIKRLPQRSLDSAVMIRDYVVSETTPRNAKYVLAQFAACCKFAVNSGLLESNPFDGMAADIKRPKAKKRIDPFTKEEAAVIIQRFRQQMPAYAPFVEFRFLTGCRPSEAIALKWGDINARFTKITFSRAAVRCQGQMVMKSLKTEERREFRCNGQLANFLQELHAVAVSSGKGGKDDLVFPSPNGKLINESDFLLVHWKGREDKPGLVTQLVEEGSVSRYRCFYNTRHSFITWSLKAGIDVVTIAQWVGNSPKTIFENYAGYLKDDVAVPEF